MALTKRQTNKIDRDIEGIVGRRLSGVPINILDISKVFRAGYAAFEAGASVEDAVVARYLGGLVCLRVGERAMTEKGRAAGERGSSPHRVHQGAKK